MSARNPLIPLPIYLYGDKEDKQVGDARARGHDETKSERQLVSNANDSDSQVIDLARKLRSRFGQGVRLTYHATPEQTQGRRPYWWGAFDV